jgi:hypothetical protein
MGNLKCIFCGETIEDNSTWCRYCGASQTISTVQTTNIENPVYIHPAVLKNESKKGKIIVPVILIILSIIFIFCLGMFNAINYRATGIDLIPYSIGSLIASIGLPLSVAFVTYLIRKKISTNKDNISVIFSFAFCFLIVTFISFVGAVGISVNANKSVSSKSVLVKSADGSISVSVPKGWNTKDTKLNSSAAIAVSNIVDGQFAVVLKQPKSDFADNFTLDDYMAELQKIMSSKLANPVSGKISNVTINGYNTLTVDLSGTLNKIDLSYWVYVIEGKSDYYQIIGWTGINLAKQNKPIIEKVMNSFQETA